MKKIVQCILVMMCLLMAMPTQAQFLNKLKKKVSDAVENKVIDKTADKAASTTDKGMEGVLNPDLGVKKTSKSPKSSYKFSYKYVMDIEANDHNMQMEYFLHPGSNYVGMAMNQSGTDVFLVMDHKKEAVFTFMESSGMKIVMGVDMDVDQTNDWVNNEYEKSDYRITDLPSKTILGYACQGKRLENNEYVTDIYFTKEVKGNMMDFFGDNPSGKKFEGSSVLAKHLKDFENSMMLQMESTEKKGNDKMRMTAVKIDKVNREFTTDGYRSM